MKGHQARELLKKHKEGTLTSEEQALLETWYLTLAKSRRSAPLAEDELNTALDEIWQALPIGDSKEANDHNGMRKRRRWIMSIAATILIVCALSIYFYNNKAGREQPAISSVDDFLPGDNRAILTLADGEKITLNDAKIGTLAKEGQTAITKTKEGEIVYRSQPGAKAGSTVKEALSYNILSTPKAGQYQVQLPDGTHVWLNALSSIRFPSAFAENERIVKITGEVYFEVAKVNKGTKRIPFKVISGDQTIEVLGTRFNVISYDDEETIETTLLEGSIKINIGRDKGRGILLKPGQQIQVNQGSKNRKSAAVSPYTIRGVDTQSIVSWKDGYFRFDNTGLAELMRQISRWYDIEVVYEAPVKDYEFVGKLERSAKLSKVLKILELGGVQFRVEENKLIVTE
ncbi:FecR family protein [Parapedobacter indicus]|uniref:FecR family protein n=1 Tax=Parapedobacter indicus TaxID=1477437 RepID=A0A1I3LKT6_9SPHI|nr:FecR family protein [Parapedobacter indicus]PPL01461.1 FecR family protein [Parapedobacter indicus]SFI85105.1 FecR family protein [Parapedobacter indicus]